MKIWFALPIGLLLCACSSTPSASDAGCVAGAAGCLPPGGGGGGSGVGGGDGGWIDGGDPDGGASDAGAPECAGGESRPCYDGPAGTSGVGACKGGMQTCGAMKWSACVGQVLPGQEICGNGLDEDCNGASDDVPDFDGDGFTRCDGDCCELAGAGCGVPVETNPAAFDVPGNQLDDDCNGVVDDVVTCDDGLALTASLNASDIGKALDLCGGGTAKLPGVVNGQLTLLDGTGAPKVPQHSIQAAFGNALIPRAGKRMVALSTGSARVPGQPGYLSAQNGFEHGATSQPPADWLSANGGAVPSPPACVAVSVAAADPVMVTLTVRVPGNARSFSVDAFFLSADYPEWVCSPFVDVFVTLLDSTYSGAAPNPGDKNLAVSSIGAPINANLAHGNSGPLSSCLNGTVGCSGSNPSSYANCTETMSLSGTGFDVMGTGCGSSDLIGGGTGWLTLSGNVVPGEIITLRFAIWDSNDGTFDSTVLLDNFRWSNQETTPGAVPAP